MSKFAFESFAAQIRRRRSIQRPIACDTWTYTDSSGKRRQAKISVAKPRRIPRDPKGDWFCAVHISGWRRHVIPAFGIGPLDSLANGLQLVKAFQETIGTSHIIVQGGKRLDVRDKPANLKSTPTPAKPTRNGNHAVRGQWREVEEAAGTW